MQDFKAPFEAVADLWTSAYFGHEFARGAYDEALGVISQPDTLLELEPVRKARELADQRRFFHWELAFPEVFYDENGQRLGEAAGFDALVGNPPYGVSPQRDLLATIFPTTLGNSDVYVAFIERGIHLSRSCGNLGYIIPVTWQTGVNYSTMRAHLLKASISEIVNLPFDLFPDAYIDTGIVLLHKQAPPADYKVRCYVFAKHRTRPNLEGLAYSLVEQSSWDETIILDSVDLRLIQRLDNRQSSAHLGALTESARGILVGRDEDVRSSKGGPDWHPYFTGELDRYLAEEPGNFVLFGDNLSERPASVDVFRGNRLLVRRLVSRQDRLMATAVTTPFVVKKDIYVFKPNVGAPDLHYLLAAVNSKLLSFAYLGRDVAATKDDFRQTTLERLRTLPIRRIEFTTPPDEREALGKAGIAEAAEWIEAAETTSAGSAPFSAFSDSTLGRWLHQRLSAEPEQADVVHDLLAHLAERMIAMHQERQERIEAFWLDLEGVTDAGTFDDLKEHGKWESTLWKDEPCRPFVDEESRSTRHLDESLAWNEGCFKAFVKALAGRVPNLSQVVGVYRAHHPAFRRLVRRIQATDRLIDLIVYRLYGLTEEEVAVVEESG